MRLHNFVGMGQAGAVEDFEDFTLNVPDQHWNNCLATKVIAA